MTAPENHEPPEANQAKAEGSIVDKIVAAVIPLGAVIIVASSWLLAALGVGEPRLEIVSFATQDSIAKAWNIGGRVLLRDTGRPARVRVWAIAVDSTGNRFSPADTVTDAAGRFQLGPIPARFTTDSLQQATDVTVFASAVSSNDSSTLRGEENLRLTRFGGVRWVETPLLAFLSVALIFVLTIIIGLVRLTAPRARRGKYYSLVGLSFLLTFTMIYLIATSLRSINASASQGDVMALGFANIYRGSYVKDVPPEWLFSLTAPQVWRAGEVTSGFGIPLWLLLIAVLGSGVYTIALLVRHVTNQASLDSDTEYPKRIGELVEHQFYLLFSPLGAVLVYQIMVAAGAASVQATVAVVIFAAGVAVNALLDKAIKAIQNILK